MKVFFDNNVPAPLRRSMPHHQVSTAWEVGWATTKNGILLGEVEQAGFEVMVTGDKNIQHQQNLADRKVSIVVVVGTTRWSVLRNHTAPVVAEVDRSTPGSYVELPDPSPPKPRRLPITPSPRRSGPKP